MAMSSGGVSVAGALPTRSPSAAATTSVEASSGVVPPLTPLELMAAHRHSEQLTFPTGSRLFQRGNPADAIYGIRRGLVHVVDANGTAVLSRQGELISYQDILWRDGRYRTEAVALTPVEVLRLDRLSFLNLLHNHPTLAVKLLGQQHDRLREQRSNGTLCY